MKKKTVLYLIIGALALALVNVLAFAVPALNHPESWIFWLVYGVLTALVIVPAVIGLIIACKAKKEAVLLQEPAETEAPADRTIPLEKGETVSLSVNAPAGLESERLVRPGTKPVDASALGGLPKAKTRMTAEYVQFLESRFEAKREAAAADAAEDGAAVEKIVEDAAAAVEDAVEKTAEAAAEVAETAETVTEETQA